MTPATPAVAGPDAATYHHGDLPNVLRRAAAEVLAERGVAGFSLREVARRAGVSHAAPAHHFGDAEGLLTSVAVEGFQHLTAETTAATDGVDDPVEALAQLARAYVTSSLGHPGHCGVMFRADAVDTTDPEYQAWGQQAYGVLLGAVERLARAQSPDLDVELAASLCWSMVQGLVTVHAPLARMAEDHGLLRPVPSIADLADQLTRLLVAGLVGRPA